MHGSAVFEPVPRFGRAVVEPVISCGSAVVEPVPMFGRAVVEPVPSCGSAVLEPVTRSNITTVCTDIK